MTKILIARHGNTFDPGDTVLRLGLRSDWPLSNSGRTQATKLGLKLANYDISCAFTSELKRTQETISIADPKIPIIIDPIFNEIDYGPDEGKPETEVIARLGENVLKSWDKDAKVPPGWLVDPQVIVQNWFDFASMILKEYTDKTILVVTSNGIARFAPYLTGNFIGFAAQHKIKMATAGLSCLTYVEGKWAVEFWNELV